MEKKLYDWRQTSGGTPGGHRIGKVDAFRILYLFKLSKKEEGWRKRRRARGKNIARLSYTDSWIKAWGTTGLSRSIIRTGYADASSMLQGCSVWCSLLVVACMSVLGSTSGIYEASKILWTTPRELFFTSIENLIKSKPKKIMKKEIELKAAQKTISSLRFLFNRKNWLMDAFYQL